MYRRVPALAMLSLSLPFLGLTGWANAQQSCDYPVGSFDQVYGVNKVTMRADAGLNVVYQKLLKKLPAVHQQTLRQTQRAWMAKRDKACVLNFLNDRLRECNSSGCQPSKIR